ncbi:hypothetical protein DPMN_137077 [Dreissena polymorpha]|uniref:Uncharacterized protein n=1 Tax=Dreissena polymorpha TaxID=45954 RepID=A0A9D4G177_DREPO|nr:hypothetical protein DPMN_137077 [Dreissena polymorpha]
MLTNDLPQLTTDDTRHRWANNHHSSSHFVLTVLYTKKSAQSPGSHVFEKQQHNNHARIMPRNHNNTSCVNVFSKFHDECVTAVFIDTDILVKVILSTRVC